MFGFPNPSRMSCVNVFRLESSYTAHFRTLGCTVQNMEMSMSSRRTKPTKISTNGSTTYERNTESENVIRHRRLCHWRRCKFLRVSALRSLPAERNIGTKTLKNSNSTSPDTVIPKYRDNVKFQDLVTGSLVSASNTKSTKQASQRCVASARLGYVYF